MQDDTKQTQKVMAKRTAKNSVFLDLFQDKKNLLALYKTLHPEDTDATEDTLDIVTIDNVLTDNLYNDLGIMVWDFPFGISCYRFKLCLSIIWVYLLLRILYKFC